MIEYRVLGPLEVREGDRPLPLGGAKQRALLALLILNANRVVSRERLIDELWGDEPPETAVTSVQVYVSRLRKLLPPETLVTRAARATSSRPSATTSTCFDSSDCVAEGREALDNDDAANAATLLRDALEALARPGACGVRAASRSRRSREAGSTTSALRHSRSGSRQTSRSDGTAELIGELEVLIAEHPHRERLTRPADARALPVREAGGGAGGVPADARARSTSSASSPAQTCSGSSGRS